MVLHGTVLYCVGGFRARAVSRKTPIYFMQVYFWEIGHTVRLVNPHYIYHNWKKNIKSFAGCFTFQLFTKIAWYLCMTLSNSNNLSIQQLVLLCNSKFTLSLVLLCSSKFIVLLCSSKFNMFFDCFKIAKPCHVFEVKD